MSEKNKKYVPGERQALAIHRVMQISRSLSENAYETIKLLHEMSELLHDIKRTDDDPAIPALIERIDQLRCLENQQELQSWNIAVGHVMDRAWKRLP